MFSALSKGTNIFLFSFLKQSIKYTEQQLHECDFINGGCIVKELRIKT
jgi:hypothetical protein